MTTDCRSISSPLPLSIPSRGEGWNACLQTDPTVPCSPKLNQSPRPLYEDATANLRPDAGPPSQTSVTTSAPPAHLHAASPIRLTIPSQIPSSPLHYSNNHIPPHYNTRDRNLPACDIRPFTNLPRDPMPLNKPNMPSSRGVRLSHRYRPSGRAWNRAHIALDWEISG